MRQISSIKKVLTDPVFNEENFVVFSNIKVTQSTDQNFLAVSMDISKRIDTEHTVVVDDKEEFFSITRGVLETDGKSVTILADAAERVDEIDEERVMQAMAKAKEVMAKEYKDKVSYTEAISELERATSRLKIIKKRRGAVSGNFDQQNY